MLLPQTQAEITDKLRNAVPSTHRFFFIAVPIRGLSPDALSSVLENLPDKAELASTLRACANYYDPQS